jgi:alpha-glucosidase (family GH31 glycosyl hydrolase)
MSLATPPRFALTARNADHLTLASDQGDTTHIFVLENDIIRVLVLPDGRLNQPRTFAIAPGAEDIAQEGRDRFDLAGFRQPEFALEADTESLRIETAAIRLTVRLAGFFCSWALQLGTEWRPAASDRPTQAYNFGWWDERVYHYLRRERGEKYFGLGERTGDMNRAGQRYRLTNIDAMGYSARTSEPLYKHIPFYITCRPEAGLAFGLFYDTLSDCVFDFGKEVDNYHGPYRSFTADHATSTIISSQARALTKWCPASPGETACIHAEVGTGLFGLVHGLYRRAGCPGANVQVPRGLRRARHPLRQLPPVVWLHLNWRQAPCVQLGQVKIPRSRGIGAKLFRKGRAAVRQCQTVSSA